MRDYSRELSEAEHNLYQVSDTLNNLVAELEAFRDDNASLVRTISGQELVIDSLRRIIIGLGHQSELDKVEDE